jgi:ATP-binding cassette subfamily B protein
MKDPALSDLVGGALFSVVYNDTPLALFVTTNLHKARCQKLLSALEKLLKNEEPDAQDNEEPRFCPRCGTVYPEEGRAVCPHCMDRGALFVRTLRYFKPYYKRFIVVFLCILGTSGFSIFWPYLSGTVLYDRVLAETPDLAFFGITNPGTQTLITALGVLALTMAGLRIIQQFFGILQGRIVAGIVPYVIKEIKKKTFEALEKLSISFFAKRSTGGLMTRVLEDAEEVAGFFIDGLPYLFINGLTIIACTVIMFVLNWKMAIAAILVMPVMLLIHLWLGPLFWNMVGRRHRAKRSMSAHVNDNIVGARVVKAFGRQKTEINRFGKINNRVRDSELSLVKVDSLYMALYFACHTVIELTVWIVGSLLIVGGIDNLSFGTLITFIGFTHLLNGPIEFFSFVVRWWANSMNSASRIFEILDHQPDVIESLHPVRLSHMKGHIELKHVTFGYTPHKNVLKDITLELPAGEMLGVVGKSGAGKSTLVNLISRLYDTGGGEIRIDGINVKELSLADLRRQVAMVSQETYIFIGTIAENIAYGCPNASRDDIVKAAQAANAHDFICKCSDGYDTLVGAGFRDLSGGERQRVSIARAILANPRILILDEATAAMDTETERKIQAALDVLVRGRTTISIAHRLSTLRNADSLVVIEEGKIVEKGTHIELIKNKGAYFTLVQLQSKALAMRDISE